MGHKNPNEWRKTQGQSGRQTDRQSVSRIKTISQSANFPSSSIQCNTSCFHKASNVPAILRHMYDCRQAKEGTIEVRV